MCSRPGHFMDVPAYNKQWLPVRYQMKKPVASCMKSTEHPVLNTQGRWVHDDNGIVVHQSCKTFEQFAFPVADL